MPSDPLAELPARLTVTPAAGDNLAAVAYWWEHPQDGPQDGLLVIGPSAEDGSLVAMWGDSWHQKLAPMLLSGSQPSAAVLELEGEYGGGWRWRVIFDGRDADNLRVQMDNVIPDDQATAENRRWSLSGDGHAKRSAPTRRAGGVGKCSTSLAGVAWCSGTRALTPNHVLELTSAV